VQEAAHARDVEDFLPLVAHVNEHRDLLQMAVISICVELV
jgi:hypothetical protein